MFISGAIHRSGSAAAYESSPMNRKVVLVALALAAAGVTPVRASVPLPIIEQTGTPTLAPVLKKATPSVVSIAVKGRTGPELSGRRAPRPASDRQIRSAGSGVVINAQQGLIVTNNHVVERADTITVTLEDGREMPAKLVGGDADTDIAVVRISAANLTAIPFGNSDEIEVGDFVLAIGNPFLIGKTVTSGIVSGLHRNNVGLEQYENFIQTDAAIYPGNSGGALINLRGDLIGINTAFIGASNTNPGMGFAIPINMVRTVADHLIEFGDSRRGRLGIVFEDPAPAAARDYDWAPAPNVPCIIKVEPGSAADRAVIKVGDLVTVVGGVPVGDAADLRTRLGLLWTGDVAALTITRAGKPMEVRATIAEKDPRARAK